MRKRLRCDKITSQPIPNSITILHNVGVSVYFEWNARARKAMTDWLLKKLLSTAASDAPVQFESNVFDLLAQPLSTWGDVDNHSKLLHFCCSYRMRWSER